jgi:octaprenyl-diphosphate synthase
MGGERGDDDFHRALALIRRHNAIALTIDAARAHAANARAALQPLPENAYREALAELAGFVVERAH